MHLNCTHHISVTDNLFSQGVITDNVVSLFYEPATWTFEPVSNGQITFGGTDSTQFTGSITYTYAHFHSTPRCDLSSVIVLSLRPVRRAISGASTKLYDTAGTRRFSHKPQVSSIPALPCLRLPQVWLSCFYLVVPLRLTGSIYSTDAFSAYQQATGAVIDSANGLLKLTPDQYNNLQSLFFDIGGSTFELTPNAQIWPVRSIRVSAYEKPHALMLIFIDSSTLTSAETATVSISPSAILVHPAERAWTLSAA